MKQAIENLLHIALTTLQEKGEIEAIPPFIQVEVSKDKLHGDYASNIALVLAKPAKKSPRVLAESIIALLPTSSAIQKMEIAGPGFINFFLTPHALGEVVTHVLKEKNNFGRSKIGRQKKIIIEFVSSNPTGPLHVGHGRHAAFGMVVGNLLDAVGFDVYREYYVNDGGRQMDILSVSVWIRYLILSGEDLPFPANAYKGDYVIAIAEKLFKTHGAKFKHAAAKVLQDLPIDERDESAGGDKEIYIDALIKNAKSLLGDDYETLYNLGLQSILEDMQNDLSEFGVHFDNWFSEKEFVASGAVDKLLEKFQSAGLTYTQDDALWFKSTEFGDSKDRVLARSNGQFTYFAPDAAYHLHKFARGFDIAIDIFGSDHHGYLQRMKAVVQASQIDPERLIVLLVQFVTLFRQGQQASMSTRAGSFVTLRELRKEVGNDAARYFYVMRKNEQAMDFDLDLATSKSNENPVYYVQYAHARICSVFKQLRDRQLTFNESEGLENLHLLTEEHERQLLNTISSYPDMITNAALHYEPYQITNYLRELAADFHSYYNSHMFLIEEDKLRNARLALISAAKQTFVNGFDLLGISAPETM